MYPNKNIIQNAVNSTSHTTLVMAVKADDYLAASVEAVRMWETRQNLTGRVKAHQSAEMTLKQLRIMRPGMNQISPIFVVVANVYATN